MARSFTRVVIISFGLLSNKYMENKEGIEVRVQVAVFIQQDGKVLLGLGADDKKIGASMWNGFGGAVEESDEDLETAVRREMLEEANVELGDLEYRGVVDFHRKGKINRVHMYVTDEYSLPEGRDDLVLDPREFIKTDWFLVDELPEAMMEGDKYWLPRVLAGEKVIGEVHYTPEFEVIDYKMEFEPPKMEREKVLMR